ncbi:redox-regulated ATPase YchF [Alphaproteobacteria bacterium]|nr:redox-regulated ATPase YchF [Alphaproteobacteria bacterium]
MGFKCGIIGLPNVGKSSLFNALLGLQKASSENYPFCTIEPNVGRVPIPDTRLEELSFINKSQNTIFGQIEFVDIAGLVKGASKGEGLGNQFLSNIREVDAIIHVVRCFNDKNISHVYDRIDPISDIEIIESELILSDITRIEKMLEKIKKLLKGSKDEYITNFDILTKVKSELEKGKILGKKEFNEEELIIIKKAGLLSYKPRMYVANVDEESLETGNSFSDLVKKYAKKKNINFVNISSKIEEELSSFEDIEEKKSLMKGLGMADSGLNRFITQGFKLLNLLTFFTSGPKESKAWTVPVGANAPDAAGVIHTDFKKGFIAAEVINYKDLINAGGEINAKNLGLIKTQGKEYKVKDGDVILFRFNV